jgi:hypothetical protein
MQHGPSCPEHLCVAQATTGLLYAQTKRSFFFFLGSTTRPQQEVTGDSQNMYRSNMALSNSSNQLMNSSNQLNEW